MTRIIYVYMYTWYIEKRKQNISFWGFSSTYVLNVGLLAYKRVNFHSVPFPFPPNTLWNNDDETAKNHQYLVLQSSGSYEKITMKMEEIRKKIRGG